MGDGELARAIEPNAADSSVRTVVLVHARQDDELADALAAALDELGAVVTRRRITGLPGRQFQDEPDYTVFEDDLVVAVVTPWLQASDWPFSMECANVYGRGAVALWLAEATSFGGSPIALAPGSANADPRVAARQLLRVPGHRPEALPWQDVPPYALARAGRPAERALLAERLEGLCAIRAGRRGVRGLTGTIRRTAQALRDGPRLAAGEMLGDGLYRLLEEIGHGPIGTVWRARDRESGSMVAVKVLHAQFVNDPDDQDAFFETARRMAGATGPSVCRVVDPGGTDGGFAFVVTEFQPGGSLDSVVLRAQAVDPARALQSIVDAGRALEAVHRAGLVHGNVKPTNLLFAEGGATVITDFAAGRRVAHVDGADAVYVAPERMSEGPISSAADVYSLGMTTLFALSGRALPFWVLRDPERLIAGLDVGSAVKDALRRAVDWDASARTPTVSAFLEGLLSDAEVVRNLGDSARESGRFGVAAEHLRDLLDRTEGRPASLLLALGRTLLRAGDEAGAEAALLEVLGEGSDPMLAAEVVAELEVLTARRGTWADLAGALRKRALSAQPASMALLLASARVFEQRVPDDAAVVRAWTEVLEHHQEREHAEEALAHLLRRAEARGDWPAFLRVGRLMAGFATPSALAPLALRLGVAAMDHLADPQEALLWLQRAQDAGARDEGLAHRLEAIRSQRGEWRQVVSLMLERAEAIDDDTESVDLLLRAARVALYAHNHHEDAAAIHLRVLLKDPEHRGALRFLARHHARAGRDDRALALYARLAPHEERGRQGEPVEVRVADNLDYANVLLRNDRPRGAQLCLEAALDLNPSHVPTLALASQLSFDLGKWEEARIATHGLVQSFAAAGQDAADRPGGPRTDLVEAHVRLGDLAWLNGDLQEASARYHEALELRPEHLGAWWGKAKVAIAGNAGRLEPRRAREEPWLVAAPVRVTPQEALARLLSALLDREAIDGWMRLDPMGPEVLRLLDGQPDLLLSCAVVDVLQARELVRAELFRRLATAFPAWSAPIESVRRLWFDAPGAHAFPVADAYRWSALSDRAGRAEFDPVHHREVLHPSPPLAASAAVTVRPSLASLHHASAWKRLLTRTHAPPSPPPAAGPGAAEPRGKARAAVLVLFPDAPEQRVVRVEDGSIVGGAADDDISLTLAALEPDHLRFERVESWFYVRAAGPLEIDGTPARSRRLVGGEKLRIGVIPAVFYTHDADSPPPVAAGALAVDARVRDARPELSLRERNRTARLDEPVRHQPKAAVFYTEGGVERMLPFVGDCMVINDGPDGDVETLREAQSEYDVMLVLRDGEFFIDENDSRTFAVEDLPDRRDASGAAAEPRPASQRLQHGDEFVVGPRLMQFRMLDRPATAPPVEPEVPTYRSEVPTLVYDDGTRHGRPIPLTTDEFSVGRGRNTDFQVSVDASLSRVHCRLSRRDGGMWVRDAGSSNGTRVNGQQVEGERLLNDGDLIEIGQTRMHFRAPTAPALSPIPASALEDYDDIDEPTEVLPVGELSKKPLPLDDGLEKIRVANQVLGIVFGALDQAEGAGRGRAELQLMVDARPRSYMALLDKIEVRDNALPGLEIMYNLAQRSNQEQRPLLNFVLGDLIERAVEQVCELLPDDRIDAVLGLVAETRHRDVLRF
jgi:tetratricopeptide (TPR) repeat protein